ncbi:hypothetical protein BU16DRAFT_557739 [Lophium mytilinum]|uniref:Uncharacterized protein n=1 Tax=Lophium mytilinum TaxID=390894 RepID=A0A6A6R673_9PEZI|nr:hypothetical protein BU16DRAFT_557739 [Lophium mytilinum]
MSTPAYPQTAGSPSQDIDVENQRRDNVNESGSAPAAPAGEKQDRLVSLSDCFDPPGLYVPSTEEQRRHEHI